MRTSVLIVPQTFIRDPSLEKRGEMGGTLTYLANGARRSAQVSLTRAALTAVLERLDRVDSAPDYEVVVPKILTQWGCEKLSSLAGARQPSSPINLVLKFEGRTAIDEVRGLLDRVGLCTKGLN